MINEIKQKTKAVVYWGSGEAKPADVTALKKANVPLYSWDQFVELGTSKPRDPIPPKPEDTCTIMYTRCGPDGRHEEGMRVWGPHAVLVINSAVRRTGLNL